MMPSFSPRSLTALQTAHPDIQRVLKRAILIYDFVIICGTRNREDQEKAKAEGKSKASFGQSPHNYEPSLAVDIVPYPDLYAAPIVEFGVMAGHVFAAAHFEGVKLEWGGHWRKFKDYPHFELSSWRTHAQKLDLVD